MRFSLSIAIVIGSIIFTGIAAAAKTGLTRTDADVYAMFPTELKAIAAKGLASDDSGLLGRNLEWGKLYSPRFQMGAGRALRISIASNDLPGAKKAFLALLTGTRAIKSDGYVRSSLPKSVFGDASLSKGDIANAASFFLGDACLGLIALESHDKKLSIAKAIDLSTAKAAVSRAINWLLTQRNILLVHDQRAPNRLFLDALAFHACGRLENNNTVLRTANDFVQDALNLLSAEGYFVEGRGWDTSYQSVAINAANDLRLAGYESSKLRNSIIDATQWLFRRTNRNGQVDSTGNRRTCGGKERFLGKPKSLALTEVFLAFAYVGIINQDSRLLTTANRVATWYETNPDADPCFLSGKK